VIVPLGTGKNASMRSIILGPALALSLAATMIAPALAQAVPSGSYQQSCQNIRMRGGLLTARCTGPNGLVRTSIDPRTCRGGDIANNNGQLVCNGGTGYGNGYGNGRRHHHRDNGYGNGGYNNGYGRGGRYGNGNGNGYGNVPSGSYQQSCTNAVMRGGVLTATCPGNGGSMTTSIDPRSCRGGDIANVNGRLQCR
jgi:hypothetical protein